MSSVKIKDLPLKSFDSITGEEIIPTGGTGNYGIKLSDLLSGISQIVTSTLQNVLSYLNPVKFEYKTNYLNISNDSILQTLNLLPVSQQKILPTNITKIDRSIDYKVNLSTPDKGYYKIRLVLNGAKSLTLCDSSGNILSDILYVDTKTTDELTSDQIVFDIEYTDSTNGILGSVTTGYIKKEETIPT